MNGLRFDRYEWRGGSEAMLRFGPDTGPVVIAALPLFEEANRTRQFLVTILRALAANRVGSVLPDVPGTGESVIATHDSRLATQREAYTALAKKLAAQRLGARPYAVGLRSGALLDVDAALSGRWHLAPDTGDALLRELERTRAAAGRDRAADGDYAGNMLSPDMLADLSGATVHRSGLHRTVRLETDPRTADVKYPGSPLWRRAESDNDIALAQTLAVDISQWIASCEG